MCSLIRGCAHCGADSPPLQCSRCLVAAYCSKICQAADWGNHKIDCRKEDLADHKSKFMEEIRHLTQHTKAQLVIWALVHFASTTGDNLSCRLDDRLVTITSDHVGKSLPTREHILTLTGGPGDIPMFSVKTKVIAAEARTAWDDLTQAINLKEIVYPLKVQLGDKCEFACGEDMITI